MMFFDLTPADISWKFPKMNIVQNTFFFTRSKQFCTETDLNFLTCTKNINLIFVFINISFRWFARRRCAYDFKTGRLDFEDWTASEFKNFPTFDIAIHAGTYDRDWFKILVKVCSGFYKKAGRIWIHEFQLEIFFDREPASAVL